MNFHEFSHVCEHFVVSSGRAVHLLEDGGHVSKYSGVQKRCNDNAFKSRSGKIIMMFLSINFIYVM